jgi:hypothetical protein
MNNVWRGTMRFLVDSTGDKGGGERPEPICPLINHSTPVFLRRRRHLQIRKSGKSSRRKIDQRYYETAIWSKIHFNSSATHGPRFASFLI